MLVSLCCWLFRNVLDAVEMVKGASGIYLTDIIRFLLTAVNFPATVDSIVHLSGLLILMMPFVPLSVENVLAMIRCCDEVTAVMAFPVMLVQCGGILCLWRLGGLMLDRGKGM